MADKTKYPKPKAVAAKSAAPAYTAPAKPAWASKTLWVSVLTAVLPAVYPPAAALLAANPELAAAAVGAVFAALRMISSHKVTAK